ncbi:MAG: class II aldolase/adducin family protein [Terracidiphilus sp.]
MNIEEHLLADCRRLAAKGLLCSSDDSFSLRIPGEEKMLLVSGLEDWQQIDGRHLRRSLFLESDYPAALHTAIYQNRGDVGAIAVSSPRGVRLVAEFGGVLPTLFDEQARHIGSSARPIPDRTRASKERLREVFRRGDNAVLLGSQLLCLGMTCERVVFNAELVEKCARAYAIARATGRPINRIPWWVRMIAKRRLMKDERSAAISYSHGMRPENVRGY